MTVYTAPSARPYQRPFRIVSWSAIVFLLGIFAFSIYEPEGVRNSTNVALAYLMGTITLGVVGYGLAVSSKEAMWKVKHGFRWELTDDKIVQVDKNGAEGRIAWDEVKSLHEYRGWLLVSGGEPPRTISIPTDLEGFGQIKQELTTRCPAVPLKVKVSPPVYLPHILGLLSMLLVFSSHIRAIVLVSAATLVLYQAWAFLSFRHVAG